MKGSHRTIAEIDPPWLIILTCNDAKHARKVREVMEIIAPTLGFSMHACPKDGRLKSVRELREMLP